MTNKKQIEDPFPPNSTGCANIWKEYLETQEHNQLYDIIKHNFACLIKERLIYKHRDHFKNREIYPLSDDNWLIEGDKK